MNKHYLVKPMLSDEQAIIHLLESWHAFGGRLNPGLLHSYAGDFSKWMQSIEDWSNGVGIGEDVPQTLYLLKNDQGTILGAVALRHYLNHTNSIDGGHIGYGICPEFRGQGLGTVILSLALDKLLKMGIKKVLVTCDTDNVISQKVILRNNGILENQTVDEDGVPINRYWIEIRT